MFLHWVKLITCTLKHIFVFGFKYSFYSIGQGKSSAISCGPPISLEMEINYPHLHGSPQMYKSSRMCACWIPSSRTLLFSNLDTPFIPLDKKKVHLYYVGLPVFNLDTPFIPLDKKKVHLYYGDLPFHWEMEISYPYLHGWPQKYKSTRL